MPDVTQVPLTVTTANAGTTYVFDSTYGIADWSAYASAVGPLRDQYKGRRLVVNVYCTVQNVTIYLDQLVNGAWAVANGSGAGETVTAGTPAAFNFLPDSPEYRVRVVNGATGPTVLAVTAMLVEDRTSGV